jgi:protein-disulfide isomerase
MTPLSAMTNGKRARSAKILASGALVVVLVVAAGAWFALDPEFRTNRNAAATAASRAQDGFEQSVRAYLLENPEVIVEAMSRLEERKRAEELSEARDALKTRAEQLLRDSDSPVGGNPNGDVSLVEFFDYNCPYCRRVAPLMTELVVGDPGLRIVYKEWPILGKNSEFAAKAALAAHRQGKHDAFHKALMAGKGAANEASVYEAAARIGLDIARLKLEMEDPAIQKAIDRNHELARALRITGTPSFVVGDHTLRGATDLATLQGLIRRAREPK